MVLTAGELTSASPVCFTCLKGCIISFLVLLVSALNRILSALPLELEVPFRLI